MDWNKGFSSSYYAYIVDPISWRETDRFEIIGGSINHESEGLRESADIECISFDPGREVWVRIYLDARQGGETQHVPVFTGLACTPSINIDGYFMSGTLQCFSVLKPAADVLLARGYYVPAGMNGADAVKGLLSVTPAPIIEVQNSNLTIARIA